MLGVPFLPDQAVVRETAGDQLANRPLRLAVGFGHRIEALRPLVVDRKVGAEAREGHRRRDIGGVEQGLADRGRVEATKKRSVHLETLVEKFARQANRVT
jgi:hypothetical protein